VKIGDNPLNVPPGGGGPEAAEGAKAKTEAGGFASRLEGAADPEGSTWGAPAQGTDLAALASDVDAGRLSAAEAVRRVVDQVLEAQLPVDASPALRERVRALVEASLESDPLLSGLVKRLGGGA
jgi:hypothetical protein